VNVSALKHYFNVSNGYVLNKLYLVLFPWRHRPWSRKQQLSHNGQEGYFLPPRDDINSPDMYIPLMSVVTYVLLYTLIAGLRGAFKPELLGSISGTALLIVLGEIACLRLAMYLLSINSESQLLDLVAYSGYKFVGVIVTLAVAEIWNRGGGTGGWVGWTVFAYTFMANAFFLVRSLSEMLWFHLLTVSLSCDLYAMCSFLILRQTVAAALHTLPTEPRRADAHSSSLAIHTYCSLF
jgi:hypothetical protein